MDACDGVEAGGEGGGVTGPRPEDGARQRRRLEGESRRRHRRAAVRDRDRPGLGEVAHQCQEPSVKELLELSDSGGRPLTVSDLRRITRGLAHSAAARTALTQTGDWRPRLERIVHRLTGDDPDAQLEAAACVTNLAAGPVSAELTRMVGGYLVTLSASASYLLQDQCIWALGNMAASGTQICSLLAAQGMPAAAISCLKSVHEGVRESAAAATAAFLTHAAAEDAGRLSADLLPLLTPLLRLEAPSACLCLAAAVASPASESLLSAAPPCLLPSVTDLLLLAAVDPQPPPLAQLRALTHLLRALTQLVLSPAAAVALLRHPSAVRLLSALLQHRQRHVRRETLLLAANLLTGRQEEEVRRAAEQTGLPARLAPLLEQAYIGLTPPTEL